METRLGPILHVVTDEGDSTDFLLGNWFSKFAKVILVCHKNTTANILRLTFSNKVTD